MIREICILERERERERDRDRQTDRDREREKEREREREREKEREREREGGGKESLGPNLEQPQGISFLQTGMEIDFWFLCLLY